MFKSVTYAGFEEQSALLEQVKALLPILDAELDTRLGPIHVRWTLAAPNRLQLSLLDEEVGDSAIGEFDPAEVERDPRFFRGFVWRLYLGSLQNASRRRVESMKREWAEPVGV